MLTATSVQGVLSGLCCLVTCRATLFNAAAPRYSHRASLHAAVALSLIILTDLELFYGFLDITLSFKYNLNFLRIVGFPGW
uniref:Putative secreted protein n=1 Tax=Ixodes ricinus TaxID=34613 RepID=A0A6B0UDF7_IXORI